MNSNPETHLKSLLVSLSGITLASLVLSGCSPEELLLSPTPRIILLPTATSIPLKLSTPKPALIDQYVRVTRNPALGIRCNVPPLMERVPEIGASWVRIVGDRETFEEKPDVKKAITEAYKQELNILYTDNPQRLISFSQIRERVDRFTNYLPLNAVELSNEPDNPIAPFWKDMDLKTLAVYSLIASNQIFKYHPSIKVGLGAFVDPGNLEEFIEHLKNPDYTLLPDYEDLSEQDRTYLGALRFESEKYFYGVHAYHSENDVMDRIKTMKIVFEKLGITNPSVWMTEVGSQESKEAIPLMLDYFFRSTGIRPEVVFIHELPNVQGFGFVDPSGKKNPSFEIIADWSQKNQLLRK